MHIFYFFQNEASVCVSGEDIANMTPSHGLSSSYTQLSDRAYRIVAVFGSGRVDVLKDCETPAPITLLRKI